MAKRKNDIGTVLTRSFSRDGAIALLRIWLGAMMIVHGAPKIFGTMDRFTAGIAEMGFPLPELFAWAAALSEFAGGILLILGLFTRPAALLFSITMVVAVFIRNFDSEFARKELGLTYLVIAVVLLVAGPGKLSLDRRIFSRR